MPSRRPRRALAGSLAVLAAATVAACGGSDSDDPGTTAKPAASTTATTPQARAEVAVERGFRQRLNPPAPTIRMSRASQAAGSIFIAPKLVFGAVRRAGMQDGPMIIDHKGRVRWFAPTDGQDDIYDFRTQTYQGKPVLTYWQGRAVAGTGRGICVVRDEHYKVIAKVDFKGPDDADIHECRLTDRGTMLMISYETVAGDTSALEGGKKDGKITEGVVKEIDVATNEVVLEWHSLDGVPITDSYEHIGGHTGPGFDYIHLNSVDVDTDGNLLVSARHTWAEYKIDRDTGKLLWKLGGKDSDFTMGKGAQTAWQHDALSAGENVIRTFDNAKGTSGNTVTHPYSRVTWVRLDPEKKTATLVKALKHPDGVQGGTQGNSQALSDGHTFVGWGSAGYFSEFDTAGKLVFDARVPKGYDTYRAYKDDWDGSPSRPPQASASRAGDRVTVAARWNGSMDVQRWQVLAASSADGPLRPVGKPVAWKDLDTVTHVTTGARYVAVRALDGDGEKLADSARVRVAQT